MTAYVIQGGGCHGDHVRFMSGGRERGRRHRHFGRGRGFGPRAGRGDIRAAILVLLAEQPMHGYQIIQELTERTGGVWRPSPGSVYPTLQQLEDEELVRETAAEGQARLRAHRDRSRAGRGTTAPWAAVAGESEDALVALRDLAHQVLAATRQVAQAGTAAQLEAAQTILRDARQSLYRLRRRRGLNGGGRAALCRGKPFRRLGRASSAAASATSAAASACAAADRAAPLDERERATSRNLGADDVAGDDRGGDVGATSLRERVADDLGRRTRWRRAGPRP